MIAEVPGVRLDTGMDVVLDALAAGPAPIVAVLDRSGRFIGFINRENIGEWMSRAALRLLG